MVDNIIVVSTLDEYNSARAENREPIGVGFKECDVVPA
jgi:hypothetical protein